MEQNSKFIIRLLLGTNALCITIICILCGEIYLLQDRLSEVTDIIRSLNEKISKLETVQQISIQDGKSIEKGNGYLLGMAAVVLCISALIYFGGIDPGGLGDTLNLVADQSSKDINNQNVLINENLKHCLRGIENINRDLLTEITTRTDYICAKLNIVINSVVAKDVNLNSILGSITSTKSDWE